MNAVFMQAMAILLVMILRANVLANVSGDSGRATHFSEVVAEVADAAQSTYPWVSLWLVTFWFGFTRSDGSDHTWHQHFLWVLPLLLLLPYLLLLLFRGAAVLLAGETDMETDMERNRPSYWLSA